MHGGETAPPAEGRRGPQVVPGGLLDWAIAGHTPALQLIHTPAPRSKTAGSVVEIAGVTKHESVTSPTPFIPGMRYRHKIW